MMSELPAGSPASTTATTESRAAEDPQSRTEVDVGDAAAVARWCKALGVTDEALLKAVQAVRPRLDKVKDYLGAGGMAGDQEDA